MGQCKETVWDDFRSHQCNRKDGHGPDGAYCKQHAKRYLDNMDLPTLLTIYRVMEGYDGTVSLIKGEVIEETKQSYILRREHRFLFGGDKFFPKNQAIFTEKEALERYYESAKAEVRRRENALQTAKDRLDWVQAELKKQVLGHVALGG